MKSFKWNKTLATTSLIALVITSVSLLLTDYLINLFFKIKKKKDKPKIQNTIKFKTLNLAFGFGLLCSALLHLTIMQFESKDTYIVHYNVSIVSNTMLGSFIYANEDTLTYMKLKKKAWHVQQKMNRRTERGSCENPRAIGPWMRGSEAINIDMERNPSFRPGSGSVFVIDISV